MRRDLLVFLTICIILSGSLLFSCTEKTEETGAARLGDEEISDRALWKRITSEADYTAYEFWPGHEGLQPGQAPHGPFHKVYINSTLLSAIPVNSGEVPPGSIIVKENYSQTEELAAITVMAKVEGYDPEHNDWFWAKYTPAGETQASGKPNGCISCHAGMKKNDYIIIKPIR